MSLYSSSVIVQKLKKHRFISGYDLDGTLTHGKPPLPPSTKYDEEYEQWKRETRARDQILRWSHENGAVGAISMRTGSLMMTQEEFENTEDYYEQPPLIGCRRDNTRFQMWPNDSEEHRYLYGFDYLSPIGCGILIKSGSPPRYCVDRKFEQTIRYRAEWRTNISLVHEYLTSTSGIQGITVPDIYMDGMYERHRVDIGPPPPYRMEIKFKTLEDKHEYITRFIRLRNGMDNDLSTFAKTVGMMDESRIDPSDPANNRCQIYLVPHNGTKHETFDYMLAHACAAAELDSKNVRVLLAGDSMTDMVLGCNGGLKAKVTFLLAGNRLSSFICDPQCGDFAGENIYHITSNLKPEQNKPKGFYILQNHGAKVRRIVVLSQLYPELTAPESIAAFLQENNEVEMFLTE